MVYAKAEDNILQDFKVQLYGTAKTHKFDDINGIRVDSLKFRPIIEKLGTYMSPDKK